MIWSRRRVLMAGGALTIASAVGQPATRRIALPNGERHAIAPTLMDYLLAVAHAAGVDPAFSVISGYRSENAGVAQRSLHMEGRAIDVRVSGIECASLAAHAVYLHCGGVGYYRASNFVHLDTGSFRTWKG